MRANGAAPVRRGHSGRGKAGRPTGQGGRPPEGPGLAAGGPGGRGSGKPVGSMENRSFFRVFAGLSGGVEDALARAPVAQEGSGERRACFAYVSENAIISVACKPVFPALPGMPGVGTGAAFGRRS